MHSPLLFFVLFSLFLLLSFLIFFFVDIISSYYFFFLSFLHISFGFVAISYIACCSNYLQVLLSSIFSFFFELSFIGPTYSFISYMFFCILSFSLFSKFSWMYFSIVVVVIWLRIFQLVLLLDFVIAIHLQEISSFLSFRLFFFLYYFLDFSC